MKALILAAGYATRLYPLTRTVPKPLLEVGDRTILDHLLDQVEHLPDLESILLVTNRRFHPAFEDWLRKQTRPRPIQLLDDGTTDNEDRLGAIGDFHFALEHARIQSDLLVTAADNLLQFPLADFVAAFRANPASHLCVHAISDTERLRRTGVAVLDAQQRVVEFMEKPREPKSNLAVPPLYLLPRGTLPQVAAYLQAGGSPEAPGHFMEWLCRQEPVFAYRIQGTILDIGTPQSLAAARKLLAGRCVPQGKNREVQPQRTQRAQRKRNSR